MSSGEPQNYYAGLTTTAASSSSPLTFEELKKTYDSLASGPTTSFLPYTSVSINGINFPITGGIHITGQDFGERREGVLENAQETKDTWVEDLDNLIKALRS